jgi:hypothetical protein
MHYTDRDEEQRRAAEARANAKFALFVTAKELDRLARALANDPDTDFGDDSDFDLAATISMMQASIRMRHLT